jgi:hypothetical protein
LRETGFMSDRRQRPLEGEIIPPGAPLPRNPQLWTTGARGAQRVYVRPVGPVGIALLILAAGAVAGLAIVFLLGAAIFGLAVVGALTIAGAVAGLLRGPNRPLR